MLENSFPHGDYVLLFKLNLWGNRKQINNLT